MKRHLKRQAAPKCWHIKRKNIKWIVRSLPGPHKLNLAVPLIVFLRDLLKITKTSKEVKKLCLSKKILVNNKEIKEPRLLVGLMDVVKIGNENYRILLDTKARISPKKIKEEKVTVLKLVKKTKQKGNKTQLTFHNGKTILYEGEIKVGDSVVFDLNSNKINQVLPLKKGCRVYLVGGKHSGKSGELKEIQKFNGIRKDKAKIKIGKEDFETLKDYLFVIGKTKQEIEV